MQTQNEVCAPRFCVAQWRASRRSAGTRSLLLVLAPLVAILTMGGVSAYAQTGCCFVWNNNGEADCIADQTADQCVAVSGWQNAYFIEGGACENGRNVLYDGQERWRYLVVVESPGGGLPGCRCENGKCEEWQALWTCWMDPFGNPSTPPHD
jgi:hypothetical protein